MENNRDKLSQMILIGIFLAIGWVLVKNIVMTNLKDTVAGNKNKISKAQAEYLSGVKSVNSLDKSYREYYRLFFTRSYMKSKLISRGEERYLGETITSLSILNNIKLKDIAFSEEEDNSIQKYVLATHFNTDFFVLKTFLNDIDRLDKNINLDSMTIRKQKEDLEVIAVFSIYMSK